MVLKLGGWLSKESKARPPPTDDDDEHRQKVGQAVCRKEKVRLRRYLSQM